MQHICGQIANYEKAVLASKRPALRLITLRIEATKLFNTEPKDETAQNNYLQNTARASPLKDNHRHRVYIFRGECDTTHIHRSAQMRPAQSQFAT